MKLFYRKYGQGFPLVILHGLYGSSDNWITIAKQFSNYCEVFIPDQRNHGQSPHDSIHNYEVMKEDLRIFFDELKIDKAIIIGHSMGGKVAMLFADDFPERVSKLIVADILPKNYSEENSNISNHKLILETLTNLDLNKISTYGEAEKELYQKLNDEQLAKFLLKNLKKNQNNIFEWRLNLKGLYFNIKDIAAGFSDKILRKQTFPTLFVKGENSDYIKIEDFKLIEQIYVNSKIVTIKNAGHSLHAEQPQIFIKTVLSFILEN